MLKLFKSIFLKKTTDNKEVEENFKENYVEKINSETEIKLSLEQLIKEAEKKKKDQVITTAKNEDGKKIIIRDKSDEIIE